MLLFPQACLVGSQTPLCEHKGNCRLQNPKSGGPLLARLLARFLASFLLRTGVKKFSRLRRGDFRYTKIFYNSILLLKNFRASGEAILGTQRYFSKDALFPTSLSLWVLRLPSANTRGIAGYKIQNPAAGSSPGGSPGGSPVFCCAQELNFFRASGEAILGTLK